MNAGLPGTGIGGVFYLLSALWMPFHGIYKTLTEKNQPQRLRLIFSQVGLALGVIAGIWLAGWMLGELLVAKRAWLSSKPDEVIAATGAMPNAIKMTMVFLTIGLLLIVMGSVHVLKLVMRYRRPRRVLDIRPRSVAARNAQITPSEKSYAHTAIDEEAVT